MKKYDITLKEIKDNSEEKIRSLCESFAAEFSITLSGATVMLQQLPTLLDVNVEKEKAEHYVNFFESYGGVVEVQEKNLDDDLPSIQTDEPLPKLDDLPLFHESEEETMQSNGLKVEEETIPPLIDDDPISECTDMSSQLETNLDSAYHLNQVIQDESTSTECEPSDAQSVKAIDEPSVTATEAQSVTAVEASSVTATDAPSTVVGEKFDSFEQDEKTVKDSDEKTITHSCESCGFTWDTEERKCPICGTELGKDIERESETAYSEILTDKLSNNIVSKFFVKPDSASYPAWKKELRILITETMFLTFVTSFFSMILFVIKGFNLRFHFIISSVVPLTTFLFFFTAGRLYTFFDEKSKEKKIEQLSKTGKFLLKFPAGLLVSVNQKIYEKHSSLFYGRYFIFLYGFFGIFSLIILSSSIMIHRIDKTKIASNTLPPVSKKQQNRIQKTLTAVKQKEKNKKALTKEDKNKTKSVNTNKSAFKKETIIKSESSKSHVISKRTKPTLSSKKKAVSRNFRGKRVRIVLKNKNEFVVTVIQEKKDSYIMKGKRYGGSYTFSILKRDIKEIQLEPVKRTKKLS